MRSPARRCGTISPSLMPNDVGFTTAATLEPGRDPALVPKVGATLVRQWRGHVHTVLVRDDGFEYEGQHYRSLTVIAERITGAHWSGPRFFGLTKQTGASVSAEAGD